MFCNRKLRASTAIAVLVSFMWAACGGNSWAEANAAQRDPAEALLRLTENPHLAFSASEKDYLRQSASRLKSETRAEPVRLPTFPAASNPAARLQEIAVGLNQFVVRVDSASHSPQKEKLNRISALVSYKLELQAVHQQAILEFDNTEKLLRKAQLPKAILDRHEAARADYLENIEAVFRALETAAQGEAEDTSALATAVKLLSTSTDERPHQPFDSPVLPFRVAESVARKPAESLPLQDSAQPVRTLVSALTMPPSPADLAANEDVQITPEILALVRSLGNEPVKIYEWVRNNIEFVPTYGSVQGSQMTLVSKRGNAFDTASLLIALLRAAGIPARYTIGTIEVPSASVMNWVGGVTTSNVAQQLLAQGGVPNIGLESSGMVTHVRLDHVWVEALIDYIPSRGAVHRQGDTWVPMDASFKLNNFAPPSNLFSENPVNTILQPGDHLFDVDPFLGKITNVDDQVLDERLGEWVSRSDEYIFAHGSEGTIEGLLGGSSIIEEESNTFAGTLPYRIVTRRATASVLPENLRHTVILKGFASEISRALGSPGFSVELSLPRLNSRRLGITFAPATQADADTLEAARSGEEAPLPVYLVDVVPVITLDGAVQGRGEKVQMGSIYFVDVVLRGPDGSNTIPYRVAAGDEIVVGITGNGVSREVVEKRFAENPVNDAPEYLHQVALHYWAECDYLSGITAKALKVHSLRLPSVGFFSSPLSVSYIFGAPRSGVYQSRVMDVRQSLYGAASENRADVVAFMKQAGFGGSYLEGSIFDQLDGREMPKVKGISSIRLISAAVAQGIPIYQITSTNSGTILPLLDLSSSVKSDIQTAVDRGRTVLVPERNIDIGPWSGVGYIMQDQSTGSGAYLISGGANGGGSIECRWQRAPVWVKILIVALIIIIFALLVMLLYAALAPLVAGAGAGAAAAEAFAAFQLQVRAVSSLILAY
jgi:transglutaminase-like putative cysteine protease